MDWFCREMELRKPDVLVISGDIFDHGLPPHEIQQLYYESMIKLVKSADLQVILTAGNHDSVSFFEASRKMLEALGIKVFSKLEEDLADHICPIYTKSGELKGQVFAIPYLRERELRRSFESESADQQRKSLLEGIKDVYQYQGGSSEVTQIAMGHFFCHGSSLGDTERELYLGEMEAVPQNVLGSHWDYVALGHLHRAQGLGEQKKIWYSGTPIPLSFKEATRPQYFLEVEFDEDRKAHVEKVTIPRFRPIETLRLHPDELESTLKALDCEGELKAWIELVLLEVRPWEWISELLQKVLEQKNADVLAIRFETQAPTESVVRDEMESLDMLDPERLFQTYLDECDVDSEERKHLELKFLKVCEDLASKGVEL